MEIPTSRELIHDVMNGLSNGATDDMPNITTADPNIEKSLLSKLVLERVRGVRYLHIVVGCISIAFALFMIIRIFHDAWRASQLQVRLRPRRFAFIYDINPAEVFPLILGFTILLQQVFFVGIQAASLSSFKSKNCRASGEAVFPAIFLLGYLHLVFGIITTISVLRNYRPSKIQKFAPGLGLLAVVVLLVLSFVSALKSPVDEQRCVAGLVFRTIALRLVGPSITILSVFISAAVIMATIITLQLYRTIQMDPSHRVAASRMVYYLIGTAIIYAFILPFFIQVFMSSLDKNITSGMIAEFALFVSGAFLVLLHLLLRANAGRTAIRSKRTPWEPRRKFRIFGPNDLEIINISAPIKNHSNGLSWDEKWVDQSPNSLSPTRREFGRAAALQDFNFPPKSLESGEFSQWPLPEGRLPSPAPSPLHSSRPTAPKSASPSYSLFPGREGVQLPATVYNPKSGPQTAPLNPPPRVVINDHLGPLTAPSVTDVREAALAMGGLGGRNQTRQPRPWMRQFHRRGSSVDSCATVQIGIRLSNALPPRKDSTKPDQPQFLRPDVFSGPSFSSSEAQRKGSTGGQSIDLNAFAWPEKDIEMALQNGDSLYPSNSQNQASGQRRRSLSPLARLNTYVPPAKQIKSAGEGKSNGWL